MNKSEKIIEAWGELWDSVKNHVNENGWVHADRVVQLYSPDKGLDNRFEQTNPHYNVRPVVLRGIENNNGWKPSGYHDVQTDRKCPFENGKQYRIGFLNFDGSFIEQGIKTFEDGFKENTYHIKPFPTHYIEVEELKPPLHL